MAGITSNNNESSDTPEYSHPTMTTQELEFIRNAGATRAGRIDLAERAAVPEDEIESMFDPSGRLSPIAFLDSRAEIMRRLCLIYRVADKS